MIKSALKKIDLSQTQAFFKAILIITLISLQSCGFRVIYKEDISLGEASYSKDLASIRIKKNRDRLSQELKNNLYDILNPDLLKEEPRYFLITTLQKSISPTFITTTGASGRNMITLTAKYELRNLETGQTISSGSTHANDNYDVSANRYGTYVAEEYSQDNLTMIIAQNIRDSLVNDFIEIKKKCLNKDLQDEDFICPLDKNNLH